LSDKIALVVVHGVADQLPGATARSVVDLLVASSSASVAYRSVASQDLTLAVAPLDPWFDPPRTVAGAAAPVSPSDACLLLSPQATGRASSSIGMSATRRARWVFVCVIEASVSV